MCHLEAMCDVSCFFLLVLEKRQLPFLVIVHLAPRPVLYKNYTLLVLVKNRLVDQWNTKDAETIADTLSYLVFGKGAKHFHWSKDILFNK